MAAFLRNLAWSFGPMLVVAGDLAIFYFVPRQPEWMLAENYALRLAWAAFVIALLAKLDPRWRTASTGPHAPWRVPAGWTARYLLWLVLFALLGGVAFGLVLESLGRAVPVGLEGDPRDPAWVIWWLVGACVLVPVQEELVYRGVLLGPMLGATPPWRVLLMSGVTFGLLHMVYGRGAWSFPWYFAAGLIFGWAFLRTRCLGTSILLHGVGNFLIGVKDLLILRAPDLLGVIPGVEIVPPAQ